MDKNYVKQKIKELRKYASNAGMQIRFKTYPDKFTFCIFIYDRRFRKHGYAVGYDGWFNDDGGDFDKCLKQTYDEIDNPYWLSPEFVDCA